MPLLVQPSSGGESLLRGPEAEAFAGCVVHLALDLVQVGRGERGEFELARQEAAQPAVGVLDAALLPRRVRVAEATVDAAALGQLPIAEELRAAVEGDGLACGGWQLGQYLADGADHTGGTPVVVSTSRTSWLLRSTSEVRLAWPWARRKISRSASQCPMAWR